MSAVGSKRHFSATVDTAARIVHVKRLSTPFETQEDMDQAFESVFRHMENIDRGRFGMVLDLRDGPMRNDPVFESRLARHRKVLLTGLRRAAIIVGTPLGLAQVERHARQDGLSYKPFLDEDVAWAHARGG